MKISLRFFYPMYRCSYETIIDAADRELDFFFSSFDTDTVIFVTIYALYDYYRFTFVLSLQSTYC